MAQPFVGQIIMFGGNFAPSGWMTCSGQTLPIDQYETLFALIGTTYGGDGQQTFQLPDLQGRVPIHQGQGAGLSNYVIGQKAGGENVTLTTQQIPVHNHMVATVSGTPGNQNTPGSSVVLADEQSGIGNPNNPFAYAPFNSGSPAQVQLPNSAVGQSGGSQPHENRQPVLTIFFCIALFGVFPTQN
jgi:microcystin-dependent protein